MKKALSLFVFLTAVLQLAACGGEKAETAVQTTSAAPVETTAVTSICDDLPKGDFDGADFIFANETESSSWALLYLDSESLSGEVLEDAVYNRNLKVETELNIVVSVVEYKSAGELQSAAQKNILSGEDPVSVYDINANVVAPMILSGNFIELGELDIDTEKPWWNKTVMDSVTFAGKCYSLAGDVSIMLWEGSNAIMFNKDMAESLNLPDQYELVRSGSFTVDSIASAMKNAYSDLDGDGQVGVRDRFGMTGNLRLICYMMIAGGETIYMTDSDGLPYFDGVTPRLSEMFDKLYSVFFVNDAVFIANRIKFTEGGKSWHTLFTDGQALYYYEPIGSNVRLRNVSFDFGFLPMPKYEESQESYITPISQYTHTMHVSVVNDDTAMISVVLENLCAESYCSVRPVYFDQIIAGKRIQDDSTIEMFDIIFSNQVMNSACVYDWGGLTSTMNNCGLNKNPNLTSSVEAILPKIKSDIQKTIDFYKGE